MTSKRTVITIPDDQKRWLDSYTKTHGISIAEAIRRGITCLRSSQGTTSYEKLLAETRGIWPKGNGLRYQRKMRSEWEG